MNVKGFRFSAVEAAVKKPGRLDLALIVSDRPAVTAAVFTTNKVKAAPVVLSMERAGTGLSRAIVVNSGNANACTGAKGIEDAAETSRLVAEGLGIAPDEVLVASTGVIGKPLPMDRLAGAVPRLIAGLAAGSPEDVARAIMTTDTFAKIETRSVESGGKKYTVTGMAKGAGMIMPNMATMLSFILTDAAVDHGFLETVFRKAVEVSFNSITIDGDTSTNDTAVVMANGAAGNPVIAEGSAGAEEFESVLRDVVISLTRQMAMDGEGATKLVEIVISGAASDDDAKKAALAIANSLLVKTAFFGCDANWGRIIAAVGYSGADVRPELIKIYFDDVVMVKDGVFAGGDAESLGTEVLRNREFTVTVDLGIGRGKAVVFTTDLSYDYVRINADYRT